MDLTSLLQDIRARAGAIKPDCCVGCPIESTCMKLNGEPCNPIQGDWALCGLIADALVEGFQFGTQPEGGDAQSTTVA